MEVSFSISVEHSKFCTFAHSIHAIAILGGRVMYRSIILGLIGAVTLLMAIEEGYGAGAFWGFLGLLFLVAPKLSRSEKGTGTVLDSGNEKQKPRIKWMLVIGIMLFFSAFSWAPKLLSVFGLNLTAPFSEAGNQSNTDKARKSERHVEPEGGFSFIPPDGWEMRSFPGRFKFKAAIGPPTGGFTPNIAVGDELWPGSLEDYIKASIEVISQKPNIKVTKKGDFTTSEGLRGARITLDNFRKDTTLRQTMYFFARGETKFVVTCSTVAAAGSDDLDAVIENSIKTFRIDEQKPD
jgi:hypothetical protein